MFPYMIWDSANIKLLSVIYFNHLMLITLLRKTRISWEKKKNKVKTKKFNYCENLNKVDSIILRGVSSGISSSSSTLLENEVTGE